MGAVYGAVATFYLKLVRKKKAALPSRTVELQNTSIYALIVQKWLSIFPTNLSTINTTKSYSQTTFHTMIKANEKADQFVRSDCRGVHR